MGRLDSSLVGLWTHDQQVASSNPSTSPELTFCANSYAVSVPPCVTTVAHKSPQAFCQMCRWQVTLKPAYTLAHWSWSELIMLSRHNVGTSQGNELSCNAGARCRGQQRKCWMDSIKERTSLPKPELLTRASCRKDWYRISAKSSLLSVKGLNWTELT